MWPRSTASEFGNRASSSGRRASPTVKSVRKPSVQRVPSVAEAIIRQTTKTFDGSKEGLRETARQMPGKALRFGQFLRAYVRAFSYGLGVFFIVSELSSGHFNIAKAIATHLALIIGAPFYAVFMAPALYMIYIQSALLPIKEEYRAYAVACFPGVIVIVPTLLKGGFMAASGVQILLSGFSFLVAGFVAARTFNESIAKFK